MPYINNLFGDNLKELRKASSMTQQQLADKLNVSRAYISVLEKCYKEPNIITAIKLTEILKPE